MFKTTNFDWFDATSSPTTSQTTSPTTSHVESPVSSVEASHVESPVEAPNTNAVARNTIIFVRHGVSCANVRKKILNDYASILDPALTAAGILKAKTFGAHFKEELFNTILKPQAAGENPQTPIVCASVLLRAQQTACFMLNPDKNDEIKHRSPIITEANPLRILPYISEFSNKIAARLFGNETGQTNDNTPRVFKQQAAKLLHGFERKRYPTDFPIDAHTPNVDKFKHLIHTDPLFRRETGHQVYIIFTHGNFLMKLLESMGLSITKEERPNYAAFQVDYVPGIEHYSAKKFQYFFTKVPNHYFESNQINRIDECTLEGDPRIGIEQYTCDEKVCDSRASMKPTEKTIGKFNDSEIGGGRLLKRLTRKRLTRSKRSKRSTRSTRKFQ